MNKWLWVGIAVLSIVAYVLLFKQYVETGKTVFIIPSLVFVGLSVWAYYKLFTLPGSGGSYLIVGVLSMIIASLLLSWIYKDPTSRVVGLGYIFLLVGAILIVYSQTRLVIQPQRASS